MQFGTLATISLQSAYTAMLQAFSDYVIPIQMTQLQFETKLRRDSVIAGISPVAIMQGQVAGFSLFGLGEWDGVVTAYDAATGVIPSARGNGLTKKLFENVLPAMKEMSIQQYLLEVIIGNDAAFHIYQKMGFKQVRELICYKGTPRVIISYQKTFLT
jgi:ribosomal protein S18 acetylase RimI-like enzyme